METRKRPCRKCGEPVRVERLTDTNTGDRIIKHWCGCATVETHRLPAIGTYTVIYNELGIPKMIPNKVTQHV